MRLTRSQLRQIIESVISEATDPQAEVVLDHACSSLQRSVKSLFAAFTTGDEASAMQHYNRASQHMKDILECLEGHPENVGARR